MDTTASIYTKQHVQYRGEILFQCAEIAHAQFTLSKRYNPSLYCSLSKEEIPEVWRASILGRVTGPIATQPSPLPTPRHPEDAATTAPLGGALGEDAAEMCIFEHNGYDSERDYCIPEDESRTSGGVYVSLVANPERFTGYSGDNTNAIWRQIYRENCFEMQPQDAEEKAILSKSHLSQNEAKSDLEAIMLGQNKGQRASGTTLTQQHNQFPLDNTCLEKRVFWRLISGMHTSISTHLCWEYLNQTTGEWVRDMSLLSNVRDQTSNVLNLACGLVLSGSRICISTTSLFYAPLQNCPVTWTHTATVLEILLKMHSRKKKSIHLLQLLKLPHHLLTSLACSIPAIQPSLDSKLNSVNDFEMSVGLWIV